MNPVRKLYDATSVAQRRQNALGFAMPPFIPFKTVVSVPGVDADGKAPDDELQERIDSGLKNLGSTYFQVPLKLRLDDEPENDGGFTLPLDPLVSINGRNIITRRYVSKSDMRGSVKERWSQDDYEITIAGVLSADDDHDIEYYQRELRRYCEARTGIHITCDFLLATFGIRQIAIESYEFPFTKGVDNQAFSIKAYSDDAYTLLVEV